MTIQIELSPLMVEIIQERLGSLKQFDGEFRPVPVEKTVAEWVTELIENQLESLTASSRHPQVVAHREAIEDSRKSFRRTLFPRRES